MSPARLIVPAGAAELGYLVPRMRADDRREIFALRPSPEDDALVRDLLAPHITGHCLVVDGIPVAAAGIQWVRPGYAVAWAFGTDDWPHHVLTITRACALTLRQVATTGGVRRVEALSWSGHRDAHRWLESRTLGFRREAVLEQYGTAGETFYVYARIVPTTASDPVQILNIAQERTPCV